MIGRYRTLTWIVIAGLMLLESSRVWADSKGTVTGIIADENGKPMAGFSVKLYKADTGPAKPPPQRRRSADIDQPAPNRLAGDQLIATAVTDPQGKFTFNNVPEGAYRIQGGSKSTGNIYAEIGVEAGKVTNVGTLKPAK